MSITDEEKDEYTLAQEEAERRKKEARRIYHAEIHDAAEALAEAQLAYDKIEGPAFERRRAAEIEADAYAKGVFERIWTEHIERERRFNEFFVDLISDPDEKVMLAKLRARLKEQEEDGTQAQE